MKSEGKRTRVGKITWPSPHIQVQSVVSVPAHSLLLRSPRDKRGAGVPHSVLSVLLPEMGSGWACVVSDDRKLQVLKQTTCRQKDIIGSHCPRIAPVSSRPSPWRICRKLGITLSQRWVPWETVVTATPLPSAAAAEGRHSSLPLGVDLTLSLLVTSPFTLTLYSSCWRP